jgi:RNA polymerase sigma-70 factor (sigma-E family)
MVDSGRAHRGGLVLGVRQLPDQVPIRPGAQRAFGCGDGSGKERSAMPNGSDSEYLAYVHGRVTGLRRTAYLLSGDRHVTDDIVQETLTKLYVHWPRIHQVENLDAYVHRILVRVFLDDPAARLVEGRAAGMAPGAASSAPGGTEDRHVLRAALAKLPPRQQAVLVLRFLCDQPVSEVAHLMRCSEGTVKSQTSHGLKLLRKLLGVATPETAIAREG